MDGLILLTVLAVVVLALMVMSLGYRVHRAETRVDHLDTKLSQLTHPAGRTHRG